MGRKDSKAKKKFANLGPKPELLSDPVNAAQEFEGLESFEELSTCKFMKVNKYGKIKRELWKDGKIKKLKNRKNKKKNAKKKSIDGAVDGSQSVEQKSPVELQDEEVDVSNMGHKPPKRKNNKEAHGAKTKKARYDNATYIKCGQSDVKDVDVSAWNSLFAPAPVLQALSELGFSKPTEIQSLVLPAAIKGRMDIVGAAETGSGKTLAFGIPIIHGILSDRERELSMTIDDEEDSGVENSDQEADQMQEMMNDNDDDDDAASEDDVEDGGDDDDLDPFIPNVESDEDDLDPFIPNVESDDENADESDFEAENVGLEDADENELGCVKVIDNVDFDFLEDDEEKGPVVQQKPLRALIVTPTRELAIQVKSHLAAVLVHTDIKIAVVVGGLSREKQTRILSKGPEIVVGTPGRLWELIEKGNEHLNQIASVKYLAIDETDRMLEQGHFEELTRVLEILNTDEEMKKKRQNFVFSATLTLVHSAPRRLSMKGKEVKLTSELKIRQLAKLIGLKAKPKIVDVTRKFGTAESLTESRINCNKEEKDFFLYYFLKQFPGRTIVFCNSIDCVRRLQNLFTLLQCHPVSLHASMHQKQRLKSLEKFSSSRQALLLATDVAARGLDIPNIQHVIHYQTPRTAESYIHRSGRTARATQEGLSVLFIDSTEMSKYKQLCLTLNRATDLPPFPIDANVLEQVKARLTFARKVETTEHTQRKVRAEENWFKKAVREAELYIDEEENSDDDDATEVMQAAKADRDLKNMRTRLLQMLSVPLIGSDFSGKYPTQTGSLVMPIDNEGKLLAASETDNTALSVMKKESAEFTKLAQTVKIKPRVNRKEEKLKKKKFKGYEKRRLKLQKEKEKRMREKMAEEES